jgi:hypothetical protein
MKATLILLILASLATSAFAQRKKIPMQLRVERHDEDSEPVKRLVPRIHQLIAESSEVTYAEESPFGLYLKMESANTGGLSSLFSDEVVTVLQIWFYHPPKLEKVVRDELDLPQAAARRAIVYLDSSVGATDEDNAMALADSIFARTLKVLRESEITSERVRDDMDD